jgi:hypothetical protein
MKRVLLTLLVIALGTGAAFAEPADGAKLSVRTFQFKYKDADRAAAMIKPLLSADGSMSIQPAANSLVVTDHSENLKSVMSALADFDAPARGIRLEVRIVGASRVDPGAAPRVADEIRDIAPKLAMLRYNAIESLGNANVEGHEGEPGAIELPSGYRADFKFGEYDPASDSIKLNDFRLSHLTGEKHDQLAQLYKASLNLKLGQTIIVGAAKPSGNRALMIVLSAKRQ